MERPGIWSAGRLYVRLISAVVVVVVAPKRLDEQDAEDAEGDEDDDEGDVGGMRNTTGQERILALSAQPQFVAFQLHLEQIRFGQLVGLFRSQFLDE